MKKISLLAILLIAQFSFSQTTYEKGMEKAFQLWAANNIVEASNLFERISKAEKENWIPGYYGAQVNIVSCFGEKEEAVLATKLSKAQKMIDAISVISENNPEILTLQAMLHTAWVAFDGATYGPKLTGEVMTLYATAEKIAPENPRVVFGKAEWGMGAARFFGKDLTPYCKEIERSLDLFSKFEDNTPFYPKWGADRAKQIASTCK